MESFHRDGFLIVDEGFVSDAAIEALRERFEPLFADELTVLPVEQGAITVPVQPGLGV